MVITRQPAAGQLCTPKTPDAGPESGSSIQSRAITYSAQVRHGSWLGSGDANRTAVIAEAPGLASLAGVHNRVRPDPAQCAADRQACASSLSTSFPNAQ